MSICIYIINLQAIERVLFIALHELCWSKISLLMEKQLVQLKRGATDGHLILQIVSVVLVVVISIPRLGVSGRSFIIVEYI